MSEPHSTLFHVALLEVRRIARTGTRNTAAWQEVIETVQNALAEADRCDAQASEERHQALERHD